MPRYTAETHDPAGTMKARVIDTHDANTIVAWCQFPEQAERIAAVLNGSQVETLLKENGDLAGAVCRLGLDFTKKTQECDELKEQVEFLKTRIHVLEKLERR